MLIGFCGVLIALRPSSASFTLPALIALTGSMIYALLMITTRVLRDDRRHRADEHQLFGVLAFGVVAAPFGWVTPTPHDLLFWRASASPRSCRCSASFVRSSSRDASVVVPYQYTLILWSVLFGWQMFAELPDA